MPFFIQFFNFFVGTIQAFVFTLLAIVYFSLAIGDESLRKVTLLSPEALVAAFTLLAFGIIVAGVAFGSAVGDGIVASKAVEAIARQPEARPNIFTFLFLGVGVLEAFPIIALGSRILHAASAWSPLATLMAKATGH